MPVPPLVYRLEAQQQSSTPTGTPSTNSRSSMPTTATDENMIASQATTTTTPGSLSDSSCVSVPTAGDGVALNLFPPYEARFAQPLIDSLATSGERQALRDASSLSSSHDESTIHDSCSVKASPHRIVAVQQQQQQPPPLPPPLPPPSSLGALASSATTFVSGARRPPPLVELMVRAAYV